MSTLSPWSPYVKKYWPSVVVTRLSDGVQVANVDTILKLAPGYTGVMYHGGSGGGGMGAAMPEGLIYARYALLENASGKVVGIVEGVGKVYPGFSKRPITPTEAALSGDEGSVF